MESQQKLAILQNTYAAAIAESVNTFEKLNVLGNVVDNKRQRLPQTASFINGQLGIQTVEDVFIKMSDVFGCANWQVEKIADGLKATATSCKLCALSKRMGGANPCNGWCLDPMKAMVGAIDTNIVDDDFTVQSTLMNGSCCQVFIATK